MRRFAARVVAALLLWIAVSWISMERSPIRDCYPRATWDGRNFIPTGEWKCL